MVCLRDALAQIFHSSVTQNANKSLLPKEGGCEPKMEDKNILLIVDDNPFTATTVKQLIEKRSSEKPDEILLAVSPAQAEKQLQNHLVTAVLCDYDLGHRVPTGNVLIQKWRQEYPTIKSAFVYTGADTKDIPKTQGVDAIFSKASMTQEMTNLDSSKRAKTE